MRLKSVVILAILINTKIFAQHPYHHWTEGIDLRYNVSQPIISYEVTVDTMDTSSFGVQMKIRNVADNFQLAMATHPEYDDRYWRYIEDITVNAKSGAGKIVRIDSSLWNVTTNGGEAIINYRLHLPTTNGVRSSWKAYLTSTGGLIGGPHSFMYVVGAALAPSYVTLRVPNDWRIATGLQSTSDSYTFFAPTVAALIDDPIFVGKFKQWNFSIDNIPHRLIYWSQYAITFDTTLLLSSLQKLALQAMHLFGRFPYREFSFMLQDGAVGSLEHNNSVTIGASISQLSDNFTGVLSDIAHEYFHTWNLMRIRPIGYGDITYKKYPLSKGLWFSEGLTIFYSDLLLRRAGLPVFDSNRLIHLQNLIRRYSANPAYQKYSAEKISEAAYGPTGMLGNYSAGTHLQGEVLGAILDLIIRDATEGKKSIDNVMRKMMENFSGEKGFTSTDIEQTVSNVCSCNVHNFFQDYVFGTKPIDFSKYLRLFGLQYEIEWKEVLATNGKELPDMRIFSYRLPDESVTRIGIAHPNSVWAKAELNTGDELKSINGNAVTTADFRPLVRNAKIGDTIVVEVKRNAAVLKKNVGIASYQQPVVKIIQAPHCSEKQKRLFEQWMAGN